MIGIDDLFLSVLCSGIISLADRAGADGKFDAEAKKKLADLQARARQLQSPDDELRSLLATETREQQELGGPQEDVARKLSDVMISDPLVAADMTQWLLEPDPEKYVEQRNRIIADISSKTGCGLESVQAFVERLEHRVNKHLGLANLRADKKISLVLEKLNGDGAWRERIERSHHYIALRLDRLIEGDKRDALKPVVPQHRPWKKSNNLLRGGRPTDEDMYQDLDSKRTQFKPVMEAIESVCEFPRMFLFLADPQMGKTTFLRRVGLELAGQGYPVVWVSDGSAGSSYGRWVNEQAGKFTDLPLVLLVDDPCSKGIDNFKNQMNEVYEAGSRVLVLVASRRKDWEDKDPSHICLNQTIRKFKLNPTISDAQVLLEKLRDRNVVEMDDEQWEKMRAEVALIPVMEGYFGDVIKTASRDKYKPIPVMVRERLEQDGDTPEAKAFVRVYELACTSGIVGLALPKGVVKLSIPDDDVYKARKYANTFPTAPIRWENGSVVVTHEKHAEAFLDGRNFGGLLESILRTFVQEPTLVGFAGNLLVRLKLRGLEQVALAAWDTIADDITESHWKSCDAELLSMAWGSFFYHASRLELAIVVNGYAVQNDPSDACVRNNYAILLEAEGDPSGARKHYKEALRLNPDYADAHYNYAILLEAEGDLSGARKHCKEALRLNPDYAEAHNNYAVLLEAEGDPSGARKHYEEALRLNPDNAEAHYNYAILLKAEGDPSGARKHYEEALRLNPDYAEAVANYSEFCLQAGEVGTALDLAVQAVQMGTLPDGGLRLPSWFSDQGDVLRGFVEDSGETALRRGGALAFLLALNNDEGVLLAESLEHQADFAEAREVCAAVLDAWRKATENREGQGE